MRGENAVGEESLKRIRLTGGGVHGADAPEEVDGAAGDGDGDGGDDEARTKTGDQKTLFRPVGAHSEGEDGAFAETVLA